jgi:hypothetical protein
MGAEAAGSGNVPAFVAASAPWAPLVLLSDAVGNSGVLDRGIRPLAVTSRRCPRGDRGRVGNGRRQRVALACRPRAFPCYAAAGGPGNCKNSMVLQRRIVTPAAIAGVRGS